MTDDFLAADREEFRQAMTADPAEKWKAKAREIVGSPLSPQGEYITAHGWMKLQEQIAAALAEAYAAGQREEREACALTAENFNVEDGDGQEPDYYHGMMAASNSITAAIRAGGASHD